MKRIFAATIAIALAMVAWCQEFNDSTILTQAQWQHALAIVAQHNAENDGYGQATANFEANNPEGYTLDALNAAYAGNSKWDQIYIQLKKLENDGGRVADVKQLAGGLAGTVTSELQAFVEGQIIEIEPEQTDTISIAPTQQASTGTAMDMHLIVDIVLALIALVAIAWAVVTQRKFAQMRKSYLNDIDTMNARMQQLSDELNQQAINAPAESARIEQVPAEPAFTSITAPAQQETAPVIKRRPVEAKKVYLAKPDDNACFTRATSDFELGNSIFVLSTSDGVHGEFSVIDHPDVHRFALMMPSENLTRACTGNAIQMSTGMTRIITDRAGEALLENGQWYVTVKAIIHYE